MPDHPIPMRAELDKVYAEKARIQRAFNRLDAAITHHKKAHDVAGFRTEADDALYHAQKKVYEASDG